MKGTPLQIGSATRWIQKALPWACVLALSTSFGYAMNTSVVGVLSNAPPADASATAGGGASNPCMLDADGALYVGWDWWVPAGRSAACRAETYSGEPGPAETARQLTRASRLLVTITFENPTDAALDLYCPTGRVQLLLNAHLSAQEVRSLHKRVCTSAGASDEREDKQAQSLDEA